LVHGDVSPKNILIGPQGPVLLDAECAWWGDPVFDLAFCLNHLLLKRAWRPELTSGYQSAFTALLDGYRASFQGMNPWERWETFEARCASLLPGLLLARIDGKSPVEYIQTDHQRDRVRVLARHYLLAPTRCLETINEAWSASWSESDQGLE
jgi:hypothetical protein